jgi:nucleotide-binding universal stress UspA family protein
MKHILVPTDFSEQANYAMEFAAVLAKAISAEITLLHVVVDGTLPTVNYTGEVALPDMQDRLFVMKLVEKGKEELKALSENPIFNGVTLHTELHVGDIYYGVKEIISDRKIDLVVMGTKGASGFEELIIGSNAERIVRHAKCPVLTIHEKVASNEIKTIAYANALEEPDHTCAGIVNDIQQAFGSKIHLVRVNTPNNLKPDHITSPILENIASHSGFSNYETHIYNDASEEEGILNFSTSIDADLIVMATHGRTGLAHLLSGSLAESVVNHTHRPVLTYVIKKK